MSKDNKRPPKTTMDQFCSELRGLLIKHQANVVESITIQKDAGEWCEIFVSPTGFYYNWFDSLDIRYQERLPIKVVK